MNHSVAALAAYAVFGTCRDLNMGAESTVALMAAATVAPLATGADDVVELTALTALLVGGWCVLGFVFQLGFISEFLSRQVTPSIDRGADGVFFWNALYADVPESGHAEVDDFIRPYIEAAVDAVPARRPLVRVN